MGTDSSKIPSVPSETRRPAAVSRQKCAWSPPKKGDLQQFHSKSARGPLRKRETCSGFMPKVRVVPSQKGRPAAVSCQKCAGSPPKKGDLQRFHSKSARSPLRKRETCGSLMPKVRAVPSKVSMDMWLGRTGICKTKHPVIVG